jgi:putative ABC transport system substrate-binding protein
MIKFLKFLSICLFIIIGAASYLFWRPSPLPEKDLPVIEMTQIIEHHTLDTVRAGLMAELERAGFNEKTTKIIYENAHGSMTTATQIANKFAALRPQVIVALSTQSAQMLSSFCLATSTPLVFTAVTDPVAAKLVLSKTQAGGSITGVSDFMQPEPQLVMIRAFLPNIRKLGVLYNPSEVNSVSYLKEMEEVAKGQGIELVYAALNNTSEAVGATTSLIGKVDAIYFPNDNTAMAAVGAIVSTALKHQLPVFANDSASVERGVLAAVAYDRFAMGQKTGEIVVAILGGKKPQEIPVVYDTPFETVVNEKTRETLKLELPPGLKPIRKL